MASLRLPARRLRATPTPAATPPPSMQAVDRRRRARRALCALLLAGLGWQVLEGAHRSLARAPPATGRDRVASIDLAHDPAWRLTLLPGIGPGRAWDLVRLRRRWGGGDANGVRRLEDLTQVPGIGAHTVQRIATARGVRVVLDGRPVR